MESPTTQNIQENMIAKAMQSMGWSSESHIPMANAENRNILEEIEALFEERTELVGAEQEVYKRVEKVQQHLKNAQICINHNLKLFSAYQAEVNSELHLYKLAEREHSKLIEDHKNVNKEVERYKEYVMTIEKEFCKRKQSINKLTDRIKWAKTALIEWNEATEDSHKGTILIEKYFKEDLVKAKQLDHHRQALLIQIECGRKNLIKLYEDEKSLEQNLGTTAKLYRIAHSERRQMVDTWKLAVTQMIQRENLIYRGEDELDVLDDKLRMMKAQQARVNEELNGIITNNREVEVAIEELNQETSTIKEQIQMITDLILLKENQVELLQKELQNLSNRVQQQRYENRKNAKEKQQKILELDDYDEILKELEERHKTMADKNLNAAQRLQILEDLNNNEEKATGAITKEINRVNDMIFRVQLHLEKIKGDIKTIEITNDGHRINSSAIVKNTELVERELKRKVEVHYELSFKCLELEREIIYMQGGVSDPELEHQKREYLAKLEDENFQVTRRLHATEAQNKNLDDNMRKLTQSFNNDDKELEMMNFKVKEAQVYCEGGIMRLKAQNHEAQVLIVDLSILKMKTNDFENEIAKCQNKFFNLERHRIRLNRTIKDRIVEIKSQLELLCLKRKHLEEEKSTLRADIGERTCRIKAAQSRFELTAKLLGNNEDGTLVTATQLRVENAQEKQLLLQEGDDLNKQVLKAEEEIKAMENTLMLMTNVNDSYRKNFRTSDDKDEALVEYKELQTNYYKGLTTLKTLRNKLLQVDTEISTACEQKNELISKLNLQCEKRDHIRNILDKLKKEIDAQKFKLKRADREVKQAMKAIKQRSLDEEFLNLYDRDLDLKDIENRNMSVLNQLVDMAENDDRIGPQILKMITERGLKWPHHLKRTRSFSSWRSEVSELTIAVSSEDVLASATRSSISEESQTRLETASAVVSVISIDFPG